MTCAAKAEQHFNNSCITGHLTLGINSYTPQEADRLLHRHYFSSFFFFKRASFKANCWETTNDSSDCNSKQLHRSPDQKLNAITRSRLIVMQRTHAWNTHTSPFKIKKHFCFWHCTVFSHIPHLFFSEWSLVLGANALTVSHHHEILLLLLLLVCGAGIGI